VNPIAFRLILAASVLCGTASLRAQYIEPEEGLPREFRSVSAGVLLWDFAPRSSNPLADSSSLRFSRGAFAAAYSDGFMDLLFAYGTYGDNAGNHAAIFVGARISQAFPLAGQSPSLLSAAISLLGDYTKIDAGGPSQNSFNAGTIGLGGALRYRTGSRSFQFWVEAGGAASLAFEAYSTGTGFSPIGFAEAGFHIATGGPFAGLTFAYRFRYQSWSMSNAEFDYRSVFHGPSVGILF
jgi:hypothetical protein